MEHGTQWPTDRGGFNDFGTAAPRQRSHSVTNKSRIEGFPKEAQVKRAIVLSTVAATLLLTAGAVSAQAPKQDEAPAKAPAAQQNAPAEKIAPTMKPGDHKAGAEQKVPETTGQAPKASDADKGAMEKNATDNGALDKTMEKDKAGGVKSKASESKASESKPGDSKPAPATTGQGAAAGSAKLSTEQRTKISTAFKQHRVEPAHLNVSVSVGARVPQSVHFYPIPQEVIVIYPEWRGYDYILVDDQIVVIDPRSHEIVAILDA